MLSYLSQWLYRINRWWITLIAGILFILFVITVFPAHTGYLTNGKTETKLFSPDLSLWYSKTVIYNFASTLGSEGRKAYVREHFTFDLAWPVVYLVFLTTLITWLNSFILNSGIFFKLIHKGNIIPLFAFIFDIIENILSSVIVAHFPKKYPLISSLAPIATLLKWIFVAISILIIIMVILLLLSKLISKLFNF